MSHFQEGEAFVPICLIVQLSLTALYLLGLFFLNRKSHRKLKAISVQKTPTKGKEESFTDVDVKSLEIPENKLNEMIDQKKPPQSSKFAMKSENNRRPLISTDENGVDKQIMNFKDGSSVNQTFTPKPIRSESNQIVYRRAVSFEMNRKTLPHFSFQQLTIDQDKANQEQEIQQKEETNISPSTTNTPTPCTTTPQIISIPEGVMEGEHESKVLKKNRIILQDQLTKQAISRIDGRDSISPCVQEQTNITKIAEEIKADQGVVIQQPSKEGSKSQIKAYVDLIESKEKEIRPAQEQRPKQKKKQKKNSRQQPKYVRYLHKDERAQREEQVQQNCCSRGFKQFNTLFRLVCGKSKDVKISKKSSFTMVYCILSFNMLLTGLHTKIVYYNHQENSLSQINFASMGAVLVQSIVLFCIIKIPFECLLNKRRRVPHLQEPTIQYMSQYNASFPTPKVKPRAKKCGRCSAKRVSFILLLVLSLIGITGIIALQVIFFVKLSLIWLCLFFIGFLFYFGVFEVVMTLFILCFEKDCQRLCGGCLQRNPDNSSVPYRAQL